MHRELKLPACRNKHNRKQYPLNKEGFNMIRADIKLMCNNCHIYNKGDAEFEEAADRMWAEATKQLDTFHQKALSDIASLMSGQRAR